jgi:hypothetical protein
MAKKDRTLDPNVDTAIRTARVAGVSERRIYESLRDLLDTPPSYRDVRASFARGGLSTRHAATVARRSKEFPETTAEARMKSTKYREKAATVREIDRRAQAQDELARNFLLGYLARAGIEPDLLVAGPDGTDALESIYEGHGS